MLGWIEAPMQQFTLLKEPKSYKESWFKIVGNYQLVKYNILIGYLFKNGILIITEKL